MSVRDFISYLVILPLVILGHFSLVFSAGVTPLLKNPTEVEKDIATAVDNFRAAYEKLDRDGMLRWLTDDAVIQSSYLKAIYRNKKEFVDAFLKKKESEKQTKSISVHPTKAELKVNGDDAVLKMDWEAEVRSPDIHGVWRGSGASEYKLRKENGFWRIYSWRTVDS